MPLDPAPTGIDADWVWSALNLDGAGISFADVERGWRLTHEDLKAKMPAALLANQNDPGRMNHGTAVLGLVVGVDNDKGIVGVAPGVLGITGKATLEPVDHYNCHQRPNTGIKPTREAGSA